MKQSYLFALLLLFVAVVHTSSLVGDYVFDDKTIVLKDEFYNFWSFEWLDSRTIRRPIGRTLFAVQFEFLGTSAAVSHGVNIAIHLGATFGLICLVDLVLRHRFAQWADSRRRLVVASSALLWGIHPLTTATVTYSIQRFESLAAMGMIWSLYFWLRSFTQFEEADALSVRTAPSRPWWIASLLAACFAFGSKETSAGLPFVLMLADRAVLRSSWREAFPRWLGAYLLLVPIALGATLTLPGLFDTSRIKTVGFGLVGIDATGYILGQPLVYLRYLKLTVLPTDLVLDYGWIPSTVSGWIWLGALLWIVILASLVWLWRRNPLAAWALSWALLVLGTTSFIPTQDMIYDHRFYLPLGIVITSMMVWIGSWESADRLAKPILAAVAVLAILLSFATFTRNLDYASALRLAQVDAKRQPSNPRAAYRVAAFDDGSSEIELERALRRAIGLSEERGYWYAGTNYKWRRELADLLFLTGRHDEAQPWYVAALKEKHNPLQEAEIIMSLAITASIRGEVETANRLFEKGIAMKTKVTKQLRQAYQMHLQRAAEADSGQGSVGRASDG